MSREYVLQRTQRFLLPQEQVFAFFAEARNLEAITPPFLHFRILTPTPIDMRPGTRIEYRLRLFGAPFGWQTEIETFDPPQRFVDRQLRGPYALWHHTHTFTACEANCTEMSDVVRYRLPLGWIGTAIHALIVRRTLERIFNYRRDKIVEMLGRG